MTMIEIAVENVHQLDQILPAVRDLGRRHARYGLKAADYDTVAGALLGTLQQALGSEFTPNVRDAWVACYQTLAGEMKAAAPNGVRCSTTPSVAIPADNAVTLSRRDGTIVVCGGQRDADFVVTGEIGSA